MFMDFMFMKAVMEGVYTICEPARDLEACEADVRGMNKTCEA